MRKALVLAALAALLAAPAALAKERSISMVGDPAPATAGHAWVLTLKVVMDGHPVGGIGPMVRVISSSGKVLRIPSSTAGKPGIFRARIVFPTTGMWRVLALDRESGHSYE